MQTPRCFRCTEVMLSQASQLPPLSVEGNQHHLSPTLNPCGSGLARDADTSVFQVYRGDAVAGKPAPTFECGGQSTSSEPDAEPLWERACPRCRHLGVSGVPS